MLSFNSSKSICSLLPPKLFDIHFIAPEFFDVLLISWFQCLTYNRTFTIESYLAAVSSKHPNSPNPGKETGWTILEQEISPLSSYRKRSIGCLCCVNILLNLMSYLAITWYFDFKMLVFSHFNQLLPDAERENSD